MTFWLGLELGDAVLPSGIIPNRKLLASGGSSAFPHSLTRYDATCTSAIFLTS